ncbi:MAG: DUF1192 family protein [Pseudomonadota bacterium]
MWDEETPRKSSDLVDLLCQEDLDPMSREQLGDRKAKLISEIARIENALSEKADTQDAAAALFKS